jgi:hypothetical protein
MTKEAVSTSETSVNSYHTARRNVPEDNHQVRTQTLRSLLGQFLRARAPGGREHSEGCAGVCWGVLGCAGTCCGVLGRAEGC